MYSDPQSSISCGLLPEIQILTLSRWQNTPHLLWPCISLLHIFFLFLYVFRPANLQGVLITGFVLCVSQRACPCGPCKKWYFFCHFQNLTVLLPQVPRPWRRLLVWWSRTFSFLFPEGSSSCYFWVTWHSLSCIWERDYRGRENLEYWQPTHARRYQVKKCAHPNSGFWYASLTSFIWLVPTYPMKRLPRGHASLVASGIGQVSYRWCFSVISIGQRAGKKIPFEFYSFRISTDSSLPLVSLYGILTCS